MNRVHRSVRLTSSHHYGAEVPPEPLGYALLFLGLMYRKAVRMAFAGRSTLKGRRPEWLAAACDVRFLELTGRDETTAHFEAPRLGDAAEELYRQKGLWPTRPPAEYTGFELLAGTLGDVASENSDSENYDEAVLRVIVQSHLLKRGFKELRLEELCFQPRTPPVYAAATVESAKRLRKAIPPPRRVSVAGKLDMIRDSTQSFALQLDDGAQVGGAVLSGDMSPLPALFRKRVVVHGAAIYRPSGRLLRLDAERIEDGQGAPSFWSNVPGPLVGRQDLRQPARAEPQKSGVAAFFGQLPRDESDEEVFEALKELS